MKLLIITQKVDINDDILGFFHGWLEKLAEKFEKIIVICLQKGEYKLSQNVKVLSLGKETGRSRLKYLWRFYKYIWWERKNYDAVFVHMNQEYIILGGLLWRLWSKKIALWYNHQHGNLITKLAGKIANLVFYTSPFAFTSRFKNAKIMPAGIDTELFRREENIQRVPNSILYLGRISSIKNIDVLIKAIKSVDRERVNFVLNIAGEPGGKDKEYFEKIKELSKDLENKRKIKFLGKIPNYKTPEIYNQNEIFVNLSPSGLFDKTILEAMACQILVLASSRALQEDLPDCLIFEENNIEDLKNKIINLFKLEKEEKERLGQKLREYIIKNHNLDNLVEKFLSL